jgi:hypothetical protein
MVALVARELPFGQVYDLRGGSARFDRLNALAGRSPDSFPRIAETLPLEGSSKQVQRKSRANLTVSGVLARRCHGIAGAGPVCCGELAHEVVNVDDVRARIVRQRAGVPAASTALSWDIKEVER